MLSSAVTTSCSQLNTPSAILEVKASIVVATLRVLCDQVRSLSGVAAIELDHGAPAGATPAEHERNARELIAMMINNLEGEVLRCDAFGPLYRSLDELVLRSSRLVLWTQLGHLQALVDNMQQQDQATPLPQQVKHRLERWLQHAYVLASIRKELARIDAMWTSYRPSIKKPSPARWNSNLYRTGIAMAQFAIREIGRNQVVAQFFRDGTYLDPTTAGHHCELVLGVLELEIGTMPDNLLSAQQPATVSNLPSISNSAS